MMRRVLVTGNAGSGKTTLASELAARLQLPGIGLDKVVWRNGWVKAPALERKNEELSIANRTEWVVDGVSNILLQAADMVVFLDFPRSRCFLRVLRRNLPYLFRSRPDLPERCPEILIIPTLVKIIWRFPKRVRPGILEEGRKGSKHFVHIRNNDELKQFLASI